MKMRLQIFSLPLVFGLVNAPHIQAQSAQTTAASLPSFEVASIKPSRPGGGNFGGSDPDRFHVTDVTTKWLIEYAYNDFHAGAILRNDQLLGGPGWINTEKYDVNAKVEDSLAGKLRNLSYEERQHEFCLMVQALLADRFKLKIHHETREHLIYVLVVAKGGPKFLQTRYKLPGPDVAELDGPGGKRFPPATPGMRRYWVHGPVSHLAMLLARAPDVDRLVLDQTGIEGSYDLVFEVAQDQSSAGRSTGPGEGTPGTDSVFPATSSGPSIFTALQEQLGLKLVSTKGPVDVIVIDRVGRPSEN